MGAFLGAAFFQFQTTYWKGGSEMNFGLFGLGDEQIGETGEVCEMECRTWPVHCLATKLACHIRAGAVTGGTSVAASRLSSKAFGKRIVLRTQVLLEADSDALRGGLSLTRTVVVEDMSSPQSLVEPM